MQLQHAVSLLSTAQGVCMQACRGPVLMQCRRYAAGADPEAAQPSTSSRSDQAAGRYGSHLLDAGKQEQFKRMSSVLGVQSGRVTRVTLSLLQTLKYLPESPEYKQQLAAYRVAALGREMQPLLSQTSAFLAALPSSAQERPDADAKK